ncbi:MAG: 4Fe-4S binding protein [Betaproteobacteria bacterium]|nr:4Fe-4S binding protein [Betaproteobacteria bacterium]
MSRLFLSLIAALCFATGVAPAIADSYEAPLPPQLASDPELCAHVPCKEVIPGAESFAPRKGRPPYAEAYATKDGRKSLVGYVFLSTDIVDIPAYSGKPVVTLMGMDTRGVITGVRILKHSEPILLLGIPESALVRFIGQYVGKFAGDKVEVGKTRGAAGHVGVDAISGATVTVIAENQVIMRSAHEVARQVGIIKAQPKPQARFTDVSEKLDWRALVEEGSIQRLTIKPAQVGEADAGQPYIDLYFGYLNASNIGRNVLGAEAYRRLMADLKPNEHAIFIVSNGAASFKGSGFVRGGIFDRIQVAQGLDTFTFRDLDYLNLYGIEAAGAPSYRESGIFIIRDPSFSAAYPWSLVFLSSKVDQQTGARTFASFDSEYWLPARYLADGRPVVERPEPTWVKVWKAKALEISVFVLFLAAVTAVYASRDKLVRRATRKDHRWVEYPKYAFWISSILFVGFYAMAVPSITHVLTWFHSLVYEWRWELFLSDPLIFIFWWFIIITVFIWGRGLFCGWLCPYGSLAELAHKVAGAIGLKRYQFYLPMRWHNKLKWLKYGIFALLVALSFYSIGTAEKMAEVEPFKSTFLVGCFWTRAWPFVAYWVALFVVSMFTERPFCKYLCPLGAGLAIPTTIRAVPLKRKAECQTCHACQKGCGSLAIDDLGRIDQRECLLCLGCQILYYDPHTCPPLSKERRRRSRAGLPLTPIGADGYYIPIKQIQ